MGAYHPTQFDGGAGRWCRKAIMMTSSNGNIFRVTGPLSGEFSGQSPVTSEFPPQRPVTRNFDVFFDLHLNKRLSKLSRRWWSETPSRPLWRHCNDLSGYKHVWCMPVSLYTYITKIMLTVRALLCVVLVRYGSLLPLTEQRFILVSAVYQFTITGQSCKHPTYILIKRCQF